MNQEVKQLEVLLAKVMHEFSFLIDVTYEMDDIGIIADEDSTFLVFRRAYQELKDRNCCNSSIVQHVYRKIEDAYAEAFDEPLPPLEEEDDFLPDA